VTWLILVVLDKTMGIRASKEDEIGGLDLAVHGEFMYEVYPHYYLKQKYDAAHKAQSPEQAQHPLAQPQVQTQTKVQIQPMQIESKTTVDIR